MGKGDKKTKRGKLFKSSHGKSNPRKQTKAPAKPEPKAAAPRAPRVPREQAAPELTEPEA
jgi:ribosomal small subunit protein bTHX